MHVDNLFGQHAATDNGKCYFNAFNAVFKNPDITPWNAFPFWTFNNLKINKHRGEKIVHWLRRTSFLKYHSKAFSVMKSYVCLDKICAELLSSISSVVSFFFHFFAVILVLPPFLISSHCLVPFFIVFYMLSPPFSILCWFRGHDFLGSPFFITFKCFLQVLSGHTAPISMHNHWCDAV